MLRFAGFSSSSYHSAKKTRLGLVAYVLVMALMVAAGVALLVKYSTFEGCVTVGILGVLCGVASFILEKKRFRLL